MLARVVNAQLAGRVVSRARAVAASSATHQSARPPFTPRPRASSRRARGPPIVVVVVASSSSSSAFAAMSSSAASAPPPQQTPPPPYGFSSAFDSGNGELVSATADVLTVRMTEEPFTEADGRRHFQWFHFRVTGNRGNNLAIVIANAGESSYPDGWDGYKAFISADRKTWTRVQETSYDGAALTIRLSPTPSDCVHLAYFVPYAHEKHLDLVARACASAAPGPIVTHETLGLTLDGRAIDALRFGEPGVWTPEPRAAGLSPADAAAVVASTASAPAWERDGGVKRNVWIIARQHPGESMASWWMEGFVGRLLDPEDAVAKKALRRAVVRVVPCVNPDGAARGYLRVNASGANLNREWETPSLERSPEVYHVRNAMDATGPVDLMLDVHGDEAEARSPHTGSHTTPFAW
jgi:murein tripeptide amidase MpaA